MIAKEGWVFVVGFSVLGFACISITPWTGKWAVYTGILFLILGCFSLFFFRNPERVINPDEKLILSAADGVVMEVVGGYKEGNRSGIMVKNLIDSRIEDNTIDAVGEPIVQIKCSAIVEQGNQIVPQEPGSKSD